MSEQDRRSHLRVYNSSAFQFSCSSGTLLTGKMVDIGLGGMRFLSDAVLEVGEVISSDLRFPNGRLYPIQGMILSVGKGHPTMYRLAFTPGTMAKLTPF